MRGAREPARAAPHRRGREAALRLLPQKSREVPRNRRIGGVGQTDLLKPDSALTRRHLLARRYRKESVEEDAVHVVHREHCRDRAADQFRAAAEERDRPLAFGRVRQKRLFGDARLVPQPVQLPRVDTMARGFEPALQKTREREIHVVAAEQDVIADGDAFERQLAVAFGDGDQAEVRRAAADVAHEHEVADFDAPAPLLPARVEPGVECRLGLFEQRDVLEPRALRGSQRQLARLLVERRRNGEQHLLVCECVLDAAVSHTGVERGGQMSQVSRGGVDRRNALNILGAIPTAGLPPFGPLPHARARTLPTRRDVMGSRHRAGEQALRRRASVPAPRAGRCCRRQNPAARERREMKAGAAAAQPRPD